jgi:type IV secretory pathway TrbD component
MDVGLFLECCFALLVLLLPFALLLTTVAAFGVAIWVMARASSRSSFGKKI